MVRFPPGPLKHLALSAYGRADFALLRKPWFGRSEKPARQSSLTGRQVYAFATQSVRGTKATGAATSTRDWTTQVNHHGFQRYIITVTIIPVMNQWSESLRRDSHTPPT
jgi:hypothetical protein